MLLRLSTRSNKQTCLLKFLTIYMLFVKHLCSNIFHKMVCYTLKKSWKEFCWFWTIIQHDLSHLVGTLCFYFSRNLLLSFLLWHGLKFWPIQGKGLLFQVNHCLSLLSKHIYFWKIWMSSLFHFVDLDGTILNLIRKFANKTKMCNWCFQFFF